MSKYMITDTTVYRVDTVEEVELLHEELANDPKFTLASFSYKTKYSKSKGEIIDEWQQVTAKRVFTEEKNPDVQTDITYTQKEFEANFE